MSKDKKAAPWVLITLVGEDRPGIVARVTRALFVGGYNLGETSMLRLGGLFTIMMMVDGSARKSAIEEVLAPVVQELGLRLHVDEVTARLHDHKQPDVQVTIYGADRTGIVADVTGSLAEAGLDILDLNSDVAGTEDKPVYILMLEGHAANGIAVLEQALDKLKQKGIDAHLQSIETLVG